VAKGSADEPGADFMSVDKKHRQLTLIDPNAPPPASDGGRRVGVAAPKMFAFDALFTQDDSQVNGAHRHVLDGCPGDARNISEI